MSNLHFTGRITDAPNTPDRSPIAHVKELAVGLGLAAVGAATLAGAFLGIKGPHIDAPTETNPIIVETKDHAYIVGPSSDRPHSDKVSGS